MGSYFFSNLSLPEINQAGSMRQKDKSAGNIEAHANGYVPNEYTETCRRGKSSDDGRRKRVSH